MLMRNLPKAGKVNDDDEVSIMKLGAKRFELSLVPSLLPVRMSVR